MVALHGLAVLAGWWMAWPVLVSPPERFIPMAPSTALTFTLLALAWLARLARPESAEVRGAVGALAWLVAALMLVNLAFPARFDEFLGGGVGLFGPVRLGVMSPLTAGSLLALAASVALTARAPRASGALALASAALGATVALGYLYGTPLLYGTQTIPVSLQTGLSLLVLGGSVLARLGSSAWPLERFAGPSPRARMLRAFLPATVLLVVVIELLNARVRPDPDSGQGLDHVLVTVWIALAGVALTAFIVVRLSRHIGAELDRAATERRRAEQRLSAIFEDTPAGLATATVDGRILLCNPALAEMFGTTPEELASYPTPELYWDAGERARILSALRESGRVRDTEVRMRRPDGSPLWLLANLTWREPEGQEPCIDLAAIDITARKALEQQLWQAQKLEALGGLAGGVAHDFNNILTAIGTGAELLASGLPEGDPRLRDVEEIQKAAGRGAGLTRQLLAFSRRQPFEPEALSLAERVQDLEPMLARLLGTTVRLATRNEGEDATILVDPTHLEQVILNLVVNARDAMPEGGTVAVTTRTVRVAEGADARGEDTGGPDVGAAGAVVVDAGDLPPGTYAELSVQDTGVGMDAETRARIFEPFFTTKEHGRGTGLGLSTVWGIVRQSRGHVFVESTPGAGATFRCLFPATGAPLRPQASSAPPPRLRGRETLLIVEDEPAILNAAATRLRGEGYEVLTA
ncbi:MAG TPA: ATP-binding protein, partial [Longimicrobiales bacterium]|nr:ATP-binding protein [Longimicrobiales bacterium]